MKRLWLPVIVLTLVLILASFAMAAVQIKDVDPSHWAYKSVKMLVEKGYLSLYEDSTFRGDKTITRYQLADVVARILEKVEGGDVSIAPGDVNTIRQLTVEFRKELVEIVQAQNLFANRVAQVEKNQIVIKEDFAKAQQQILDMINQLVLLKDLQQQLATTKGDVSKLEAQIAQVEKNMAQNLAFSVTDLTKQIDDTKLQQQAASAEIAALKTETGQLKEEDSKLKEETTALKAETGKLKEETTKLQEENTSLKAENTKLAEENTKVKADIEKLKDRDNLYLYLLIGGLLVSVLLGL